MYNDLDTLLKTRSVPDVPEGLSARIIAAVHRADDVVASKPRFGLWDRLAGFVAGLQPVLRIPQPAYVIAGLVVFALGVTLGMGADDTSMLSGLSVGDLSTFLEINDTFVVGEWV